MELVFLRESEPKTTTLAIAEGTQNDHATVIKLVRNYADDLEEFGFLGFEIQKNRGTQGAPTEYAILNEPQSTLLLTYMRNSDVVRQFKKQLVKAFFAMREALLEGQGEIKRVDLEHNRTRRLDNPHGIDIKYSLDLTKIVMNPTRASLDVLKKLTGVDMSEVELDQRVTVSEKQVETLQRFIAEQCRIADDDQRVTFKALYAAFSVWHVHAADVTPGILPGKKRLAALLRSQGYEVPAASTTGGTVYVYGLELLEA